MIVFNINRFGRKKTVLSFFGIKIIGIMMSWFGSSYVVFVVGRLLVGCGQVGFFISGFVLGLCCYFFLHLTCCCYVFGSSPYVLEFLKGV